MTHAQNAILRNAYSQQLAGKSMFTIAFRDINDSLAKIKIAFESLENDGYIQIVSPAIGSAVIALTEYGLSYCEEIYGA